MELGPYKCKKCGGEEFYTVHERTGVFRRCKSCTKNRMKRYYLNHKEKIKARIKEYRTAEPEAESGLTIVPSEPPDDSEENK